MSADTERQTVAQRALTDDEFRILRLRLEKHVPAEISELLGIPEDTVLRVLRKIRRRLNDACKEDRRQGRPAGAGANPASGLPGEPAPCVLAASGDASGAQWRIFNSSSERMAELDDGEISLVVTSPPYNNNTPYDGYDDLLPYARYQMMLQKVFGECFRVLSDGGRIAVVVPNVTGVPGGEVKFLPYEIVAMLVSLGFVMRENITWLKTAKEGASAQLAFTSTAWGSWKSASNPKMRSVTETIVVAHKGSPRLASPVPSDLTDEEFRQWTVSTWLIPPAQSKEHPAIFPSSLVERLVKLYSFPGQTVLDPFAGLGTTGVASLGLGRSFVGYEISPAYAARARERLAAAAR